MPLERKQAPQANQVEQIAQAKANQVLQNMQES